MKEDRIVITGMTARNPAPNGKKDWKEWKEWFKQEVIAALIWMDEGVEAKINFVNVMGKMSMDKAVNAGDQIPAAEVRFLA